MTVKKPNFMDAVKAAQANKTKVPPAKAQEVQAEKFKNKLSERKGKK